MGEVNRVQLTNEACRALVAEARSEFDNGCVELWISDDESQRPTLEACIEILGRLTHQLRFWPKKETPFGLQPEPRVDVEFSSETAAWLDRLRASQGGYVADLDRGGEEAFDNPDYIAQQVYLLHVLNVIAEQREAVAV